MARALENIVLDCLNRVLSHPVESVAAETNLRDGLEMDSLTLVLLQVELEEEFRFIFDPIEDDFEQIFDTFGSLCAYLVGRES